MLNTRDIADGLKASIPIIIASTPFGMLFGVLAVENGFTVGEAVLMSLTVFAGASQIVGLELFGQKAVPWMIVLSIFAVNFRILLYSAAMVRTFEGWSLPTKLAGFFVLTDMQYALAEARKQTSGRVSVTWYFSLGLALYLTWALETWLGAQFGRLISNPEALGMDFLISIFFFAMALGFRSRPGWLPVALASAAGSILAEATLGSPWHVSLGAIAGVAAAVLLPQRPKAVTADE